MNDAMKIDQVLEDSNILLKRVIKTIKNLLSGKEIVKASYGIKWIFNAALSLNKLWNIKVL